MTGKHRTTIYIEKELVLLAKARRINISETTENVLRSLLGNIDPAKRVEELRNELAIMIEVVEANQGEDLLKEITELRIAFVGREGFKEVYNVEWLKTLLRHYPLIRSRFTRDRVLEMLMEGTT